ncbi:MAG: complement resistance protein TraT [Desulfovibrionaceae bacterium]|nr:complement resistance protein TraT [Desulfovibrionaceae bacterium]
MKRIGVLCVLLCLGLLSACVRQAGQDKIEVMRAGSLDWQADEDIARVVYVGARDDSRRVPQLRSLALSWLERKGFAVTDNPSKAGYIVQITLLAAGQTSPEGLRAAVDAGYGSPSRLSGTGSTALLADVLLVQRRIPSHKRPSRARMKNASRRNAVDSSQLRIGLLLRRKLGQTASLPGIFAEVLGRELSVGIPLPEESAATPAASAP